MDSNSVGVFGQGYSFLLTVLIPLISAFVGALVGGYMTRKATLRGVMLAHEIDLKLQKEAEDATLQGFYRAILVETETLWTVYQETMGHVVESLQSGNPLAYYYPVTQDYFTVYGNNTGLIGRIPERKLLDILVKTHVEAQALLDSYKMNNEMLSRLQHWDILSGESKNETYQAKLNLIYNALVSYAAEIQKRHYALKVDIKALVGELKDNIRPS